jgi:hypothetical protein
MASRIAISKSLRFRILKRDHFACQYCGRRAPDVELEVDHKTPCAKGGENQADNLITACWDCNRGKRDAMLPDPMATAAYLWQHLEMLLWNELSDQCKAGFSYSDLTFLDVYDVCNTGRHHGTGAAIEKLRDLLQNYQPYQGGVQ